MGTRGYAFLDTSLAVESKDDATLTWLDEMLVPWFEGPARGRELDVTVRHARGVESGPVDAPPAPSRVEPLLLLDSRVVRLPTSRSGSRIVVVDAEEDCRYTIDGVDVTVEAKDNPGRLGLLRVVREIALEHERRHARAIELHAAALEVGGETILLAGPKGSGKTTLLLHALARHPVRLVANDRVLVDVATGRPRVTGVPSVIRIHPRTAAAFPALAAGAPSALDPDMVDAGPELRPSAARLAAVLGGTLRAAAPLGAVVFPEIGATAHSPRLARLPRESVIERLRAAVYGGHGDEDVATVFTEPLARACPRAQRGDAVRRAKAALMARLAADVPSFHLTPGPDLGAAIDLVLRDVRG